MPDTSEGEPGPRVVLILGASGGIGSAVARRLSSEGVTPVLAARNTDRLAALADELQCEHQGLDATRCDDVLDWVRRCHETHGRLDGLVNCVGSLLLKPVHRVTPEEWHEVLDQNLGSAFATVRAASQVLRQDGGAVVLLSSAAAQVGLLSHEVIAAAKAGVTGLARAAAASHASRGIRFNVVAPGLVRTPMTESLLSQPAAELASIAMHALGRLGNPEDVASAITWLLSPEQSWVTGQVIGVDGGLARVRPPGSPRRR